MVWKALISIRSVNESKKLSSISSEDSKDTSLLGGGSPVVQRSKDSLFGTLEEGNES